jgi:hypothetical protein
MLVRLQNVAIIAALAICFALAVGGEIREALNTPHAPINQCAPHQKNCNADAQTKKESAEEAIARYNWWLTLFTAILAVATLGLGLATIGLYFAGERQLRHVQVEARRARAWRLADEERLREQIKIAQQGADAASLNARAAVAVELPILAPLTIALHREPGFIGRVDMPGPISTLRINFKNWGRTHAELISQYVEWLVAAKLPEIPVYKTELAFPPGTFVESGKNLRDAPQDFIINIQPDEVEAIAKEEKFLWVYGYLSFNDFLGNPHQHRWCASWGAYQLPNGATAHGFIYDLKTPPDYIKRT